MKQNRKINKTSALEHNQNEVYILCLTANIQFTVTDFLYFSNIYNKTFCHLQLLFSTDIKLPFTHDKRQTGNDF
jgi:hypothetical protein